MKILKLLSICGISCSLLFGIFSLVFYWGDWDRLIFVTSLGLVVGFLAAPEFEPKLFKMAWLFQLVCGAIAGSLVGLVFGLSSSDIVLTSIIGGFIGWTANLWVKHTPIP